MIRGGTGGGHTVTGLKFESRISLKDVIVPLRGYAVKGDEIFFQKEKVAERSFFASLTSSRLHSYF